MKIYPKPEQTVFAQAAHEGEIQPFPDIARGWGKSLDLTGGIPPMEWFNALGKRSDEAIRYLSQRGISEWSAEEVYPQGAVSYFKEQLWFALKNNHNQQPQQGQVWQRISFTEAQIKQLIPVNSVNGKTGAIQLNAADVGALTKGDADNCYVSSQRAVAESLSVKSNNAQVSGKHILRSINGITADQQGNVSFSAKQINAAENYHSIIDLTGLSTDRYYPVWWAWPENGFSDAKLTIHRSYWDNQDISPFGPSITHIAGLCLQLEGNDVPWGGAAQYMSIKRLHQRYHQSVRRISHAMMAIARPLEGKLPLAYGYHDGQTVNCSTHSGLYLRGGLTYQVSHNFNVTIHYSRKDEEVCLSQAKIPNEWEIQWNVKSYHKDDPLLGDEYQSSTNAYQYDLEVGNYFPAGIPQPWPSATPPTGWLKCDGSGFDKNLYPLLAKAYPSGVLPDLRGEFIRGWDAGRGVDPNRNINSFQPGTLMVMDGDDNSTNGIISLNALTKNSNDFGADLWSINSMFYSNDIRGVSNQAHYVNGLNNYLTGVTRPRNIAFLYIVRAA